MHTERTETGDIPERRPDPSPQDVCRKETDQAAWATHGSGGSESQSYTVEQSEFVGAEFATDVGSAFFYPDDDQFRGAAHEVPEYPGEYVIDVHGTEGSVQLLDADGTLRELDAHLFADVVRSTGWKGQPIRLFSCETARLREGFAQQLADELDVLVTAPTAPVSSGTDGAGEVLPPLVVETTGSVDPETGSPLVRSGTWIVHVPTARRR